MEERRVVDIERELTHHRERSLALFVVVDAHVARDQAAKGIERETANRRLDAALVQFFDDLVAPVAAETFFCQIPAPGEESAKEQNDG